MRQSLIACLFILLLAASSSAANKEHEAIQRDITTLGDQVKGLQKTFDDNLREIKSLLLQLDKDTNKGLGVVETRITERMTSLEKAVNVSVTTMGARVDSMAEEFRRVREDIADLNGKMTRMQTSLGDVKSLIEAINNKPVPPAPVAPPPSTGAIGSTPEQPVADGRPPNVTAEGLFTSATRDKSSGKYDLALNQFQDFVKWFPKNDLACVAQYHIGDIHYNQNDLMKALEAFDKVLDGYDANCSRRPDSIYLKARTLEKGGERTAAAKEYRRLRDDYPKTDWATRAAQRLRELGLNPNQTAPKKNARR